MLGARGHQARGVHQPRQGGAQGDTKNTGTLRAWGHRACRGEGRDGHRDTELVGTPRTQGHGARGDTELAGTRSSEDSTQTLPGVSKRRAGAGGRRVTVGGSRGCQPGPQPAGSAAGAGRAALSQAGSPDPLNHWKIRQGSVTRDGSIPRRWAPGGHPRTPEVPTAPGLPKSGAGWGGGGAAGSGAGLSCSRAVARGRRGPHGKPK